MCLGQEEFLALSMEKDSKDEKWNSKKSFTFDVSQGYMVSGEKELILWESGLFMDAME